jgi:phosphohistidine phosphatase
MPRGDGVSVQFYFLRHGQAENRHEWQGDDAARPLTVEGKKRMEREAAGIRTLGLHLELIISSPLVRAYQTAEIVARGQGEAIRLVPDDRVAPGFGPTHLAAILGEHKRAQGIMLVGHEPDFSETIGQVTGGGRLVMKKGALAYVELGNTVPPRGRLVWLLPPKLLER